MISGKMTERSKPIPFRFICPKESMFGAPTVAMIENRWKLLTNFDPQGKDDMLYDLSEDRAEENNIISQHADVAARMKAELKDWIESCKASHSGADYDGPFTPVEPFPVSLTWPEGKKKRGNVEEEGEAPGKADRAGAGNAGKRKKRKGA